MLRFNALLAECKLDPAEVRLLRHNPQVGDRSLLEIWRAEPALFEAYQSLQLTSNRSSFARPYWASFVGTWDGRTLFLGVYEVGKRSDLNVAGIDPISGRAFEAGTVDQYLMRLLPALDDYRGRLFIDWGGGASGKRAWNQRADAQDKVITELHRDRAEAPFPGLLAFNAPLSSLDGAPPNWIEPLAAAKGVYLLACPRDGSLYVGSASAVGGFWSRWSEYRANGHGGNMALRDRAPSDFSVSILEVAGSTATYDDIIAAELRWKGKLQTRAWGLNRN